MENKTSRQLVGTILPFDYISVGNKDAKETLLVLHGFAQNCDQAKADIVDKLSKKVQQKYKIIIPNGILPIPKIRPNNIQYRYSWYFYDSQKQQYYIDMSAPIEAIRNFLKNDSIDAKNVTVLGYSQGGYLAPILASSIAGIKTSIAINANTRVDKLGTNLDFTHISLHNEADPVVDFANSYKSYKDLKTKIKDARYISFEISSHEIVPQNIEAINDLLERQ